MAIILRNNTSNNTGKGSELTYLEMDTNLESFYYSSSYANGVIYLYTTGSSIHSIDLSGFVDDLETGSLVTYPVFNAATGSFLTTASAALNVINFTKGNGSTFTVTINTGSAAAADTGSLMVTGSVTNNVLTFTKGDGSTFTLTVNTGSGAGSSGIIVNDLDVTPDPFIVTATALNFTGSGVTVTENPAGKAEIYIPGATGGSPSGSTGEVQFNNAGAFGADPNFAWDTASNILTLKGNVSGPSLRLVNAIPISTGGITLGYLSAYQDTLAAADIGGIKIVSDASFGNGDVPTRLEFLTTPDGTETPTVKLQIKNDGELIANQYGSGTFTGTAAYYVAVSASGELIEAPAPTSFTRPTSATSVVFDVDVDAAWTNLATATGPNPTSAGQFTTNSATPGSVSQIKINKTANSSVDQSSQLEDLAVSSSLTITQAGGGAGYGTYRIVTKTDNTSYMTYDVTVVGSTGGTFNNTSISTIDTDGDGEYEYILSSGYNLLNITNNGSVSNTFRFKVPNSSTPGSKVLVEAQINASSPNNVYITYQARSGSVSTTGQVNKPLYTIGSAGTATTMVLDTNDIAVLDFTTWGTGSAVNYGLIPVGATQVYNG
jgi:hypothetical protein